MGWPFVGRSADLAVVKRALRGAGLIVAGAAGVGKTALLEEARPAVLVRATAATAAIPLGVLAPLLPDDVPPGPLAALNLARTSLRGKVIGVDDAHLLDETTAVLLHQLVAHREAVVLATVRSGEPMPAPVVALWKDRLLERLELAPLDRSCVEEVLVAAVGGPVESVAVDRFWAATSGNMLLLRELLLAAPLVSRDGMWRLDGPWPMPPRLLELIESRLGALSSEQRRVLELLAFGEPLSFDLLPADVLESLGDLVVVSSDDVRLAHPLYGEALRARCPEVRARSHRRHLASVLDDPLRVAVLLLDCGVADDPSLLLAAAQRACATLDVVLAERLARAAWAVGGGPPAAYLLAQVLVFTDRPEEAEEVFALVASDDDPPEVVTMRAMNLGWGLGLLVPLYRDHALALVRKDVPALERVALGFEQAGAMLLAAEAAAATGNRALTARLAALCQGARTPALMDVPQLTKREREVASLAVRGLTNREIAASLVTSVRTIDNHLSSVYAKLGISARTELAGALVRWDDSGVGR